MQFIEKNFCNLRAAVYSKHPEDWDTVRCVSHALRDAVFDADVEVSRRQGRLGKGFRPVRSATKSTKAREHIFVLFVASLACPRHAEDAVEEGGNRGVDLQLIRVALEVMRVVGYH